MKHGLPKFTTSWILGKVAYQMFVDSVRWARKEDKRWLDTSREEQAGMKRTFVLRKHQPCAKGSRYYSSACEDRLHRCDFQFHRGKALSCYTS
eukprot:5516885-Amphidinium_carterae.1